MPISVSSSPARLSSKIITFTRDMTAATGNVAYTGVGFVPTSVVFIAANPAVSTFATSNGFADSAKAGGAIALFGDFVVGGFNGTAAGAFSIYIPGNANASGVTINQTATVATYDSDGFTLAWTKNGAPTGTATVYALCYR